MSEVEYSSQGFPTDVLKAAKERAEPYDEEELSANVESAIDASSHQRRMAQLEYDEFADYLKSRKWWRRGVGAILTATWFIHLYFCYKFERESSFPWIISSLTIEVMGLAYIIVSHLFPNGFKNLLKNKLPLR